MIIKAVEIRDAMTFIPAIAIRVVPVNEGQRYLLRRAGYEFERPQIILARIAGGSGHSTCDPYDWDSDTMQRAHAWLCENFDRIEDGAVVDVEFILGKTPAPKVSEREEHYV